MPELEEKFIVINKKHLNQVPRDLVHALNALLKHLPTHKYIICNADEPYAEKVLQTILKGEAGDCCFDKCDNEGQCKKLGMCRYEHHRGHSGGMSK